MEAARDAVSQMIDILGAHHGLSADRRLHALLGLRRPADQRDRRSAELGRVVLFPARGFRVSDDSPSPLAGSGEGGGRRRGLHPPSRPSPARGRRVPPLRPQSDDRGRDAGRLARRRRRPLLRSRRRRDALHRRRIRLRQVDDGALHHAAPAGAASRASRRARSRLPGASLRRCRESAMRRVRGGDIAMIFQEPMTSLNPVLSVGRQLVEAIRAHRDVGAAKRARPRSQALQRGAHRRRRSGG